MPRTSEQREPHALGDRLREQPTLTRGHLKGGAPSHRVEDLGEGPEHGRVHEVDRADQSDAAGEGEEGQREPAERPAEKAERDDQTERPREVHVPPRFAAYQDPENGVNVRCRVWMPRG